MSALSTTARLGALKRSLEAARDVKHTDLGPVRTQAHDMHAQYLKGLNAGLQVAIDAIESELNFMERIQRIDAAMTGSAA